MLYIYTYIQEEDNNKTWKEKQRANAKQMKEELLQSKWQHEHRKKEEGTRQ